MPQNTLQQIRKDLSISLIYVFNFEKVCNYRDHYTLNCVTIIFYFEMISVESDIVFFNLVKFHKWKTIPVLYKLFY